MDLRNLFNKNDNGQSFVEFALVLPILILLVLGIIQFGIVFYGQVTITSAAREAARMASIGKYQGEIELKIEEIVSKAPFLYVDINDVDVNPTIPYTNTDVDERVRGEPVKYIIPGKMNILFPFLGKGSGPPQMDIYGKATMRFQFY